MVRGTSNAFGTEVVKREDGFGAARKSVDVEAAKAATLLLLAACASLRCREACSQHRIDDGWRELRALKDALVQLNQLDLRTSGRRDAEVLRTHERNHRAALEAALRARRTG